MKENKKSQKACKPGFVHTCRNRYWMTIHLGFLLPKTSTRPTRADRYENATCKDKPCALPLFGLAPDGVYQATLLPVFWCALTAPFHPYLKKAVCFLWHFPSVYTARTLSGIVFSGSPDFPHLLKTGAVIQPSGKAECNTNALFGAMTLCERLDAGLNHGQQSGQFCLCVRCFLSQMLWFPVPLKGRQQCFHGQIRVISERC